MAPPDPGFLAACGELLGGVLADRLEHAESGLAAHSLFAQQAVIDQDADFSEHITAVRAAAHRFDLLEVGATHEHGEPLIDQPCRLIEELIAPADGGAQRLLAGG
jgi:hypothetical protein